MRGIVDLDNVVSDWAGWVFRTQSERTPPTEEGMNSGRLMDMWPDLSEEAMNEIVDDSRGYSDAFPVRGARDALWTMYNDPNITFDYISAAPVEHEDVRRSWLQRYMLPQLELTLLHVGISKKTDWILDHGKGYDFIIDDHLKYLDAALVAEIPLRLVLNYPWNQEDGDNHVRVYSWSDAINKIMRYKLSR